MVAHEVAVAGEMVNGQAADMVLADNNFAMILYAGMRRWREDCGKVTGRLWEGGGKMAGK